MILVVRNRVGDRRQRADTPSEVGSSALLARPHPHAVHRRSTLAWTKVTLPHTKAMHAAYDETMFIDRSHTNPMMHTHVAEPLSVAALDAATPSCKSYPRGSFFAHASACLTISIHYPHALQTVDDSRNQPQSAGLVHVGIAHSALTISRRSTLHPRC